MKQLIKSAGETGQWPMECTEFTVITLKKKSNAAKCSDQHTISTMLQTAKIVGRILRRMLDRKIEDVFVEDRFGFRRGIGTGWCRWDSVNNIKMNFGHR